MACRDSGLNVGPVTSGSSGHIFAFMCQRGPSCSHTRAFVMKHCNLLLVKRW